MFPSEFDFLLRWPWVLAIQKKNQYCQIMGPDLELFLRQARFIIYLYFTNEKFLPEPDNFFQLFSPEWFQVIYCLLIFAKFRFQFSVWNPGKKCEIQMDTLNHSTVA